MRNKISRPAAKDQECGLGFEIWTDSWALISFRILISTAVEEILFRKTQTCLNIETNETTI